MMGGKILTIVTAVTKRRAEGLGMEDGGTEDGRLVERSSTQTTGSND